MGFDFLDFVRDHSTALHPSLHDRTGDCRTLHLLCPSYISGCIAMGGRDRASVPPEGPTSPAAAGTGAAVGEGASAKPTAAAEAAGSSGSATSGARRPMPIAEPIIFARHQRLLKAITYGGTARALSGCLGRHATGNPPQAQPQPRRISTSLPPSDDGLSDFVARLWDRRPLLLGDTQLRQWQSPCLLAAHGARRGAAAAA